MFDCKKQIVANLNEILPTTYDLFLQPSTALPCASYLEVNNQVIVKGSNTEFSRIVIQIKIWANNVSDLMTYSLLVDNKMRELGFKRTAANELSYNDIVQKVLNYEATAQENIL